MSSRTAKPGIRKRRPTSDQDWQDILAELDRNNLATVTVQDEKGIQRAFRANFATGALEVRKWDNWHKFSTRGRIERVTTQIARSAGGGGGGSGGGASDGTISQYWRGDGSWQELNQSAVAGLQIDDAPSFAGASFSAGGASAWDQPNQPGSQRGIVGVGGEYAVDEAATGDFFPGVSSWVRNTGSKGVVAVFGEGLANGASAQSWGGNFVAYSSVSGGESIGIELNFGALASGGLSVGLYIAHAGDNDTTGQYLQFGNNTNGKAPANLIVLDLDYDLIQATGSILSCFGTETVTGGIDFTGLTFTGNAFASTGFAVSGAGAVTGLTHNGLTLTAAATGFTIAGGTTSKTLTVELNSLVNQDLTTDSAVVQFGQLGVGTAINANYAVNALITGTTDVANIGAFLLAQNSYSAGNYNQTVLGGQLQATYQGGQTASNATYGLVGGFGRCAISTATGTVSSAAGFVADFRAATSGVTGTFTNAYGFRVATSAGAGATLSIGTLTGFYMPTGLTGTTQIGVDIEAVCNNILKGWLNLGSSTRAVAAGDLALSGNLYAGTYAAKAAEAFAGYITIYDSGGTARKVMVCA